MPTLLLSWRDRNQGLAQEEGFRIYRDTAVLDLEDMPAPLATLDPDVTTYEDDTVAAATTYYYAVSAFLDDREEFLVFDPVTTAA
jgi:hypothetical protein